MSSKEKYLNTLALFLQPKSKSFQHAHQRVEEAFNKDVETLSEMSVQQLAESLAFVRIGVALSGADEENDLMQIVMSDSHNEIHKVVCDKCRQGEEHIESEPPRPQGMIPVAIGGSLEEVIQKLSELKEKPN